MAVNQTTHENALEVLEDVLISRQDTDPSLSADEIFQTFTCEVILRSYPLEPSDIPDGVLDGGDDGGIDAAYLFVNGFHLLGDVKESDLTNFKKAVVVDWILIQAKNETGFKESALEKVKNTLEDVFDPKRTSDHLKAIYSPLTLAAIERFRTARRILNARLPTINVTLTYAARADAGNIHPKVEDRKKKIKELVEAAIPTNVSCDVTFLGARELIKLAVPKEFKRELKWQHQIAAGNGSFVYLVLLRDYFDFISDNGELLYPIFEANVRDYNPRLEVNTEIRATLQAPVTKDSEDFWSLNNGVTVIGEKTAPDVALTIFEPQIVNGLQTSLEIFHYFKDYKEKAVLDTRRVLVRVIRSESPESQDRIIRATNRQTAISEAQLHATEEIHRDIQAAFSGCGLLYDRRKNYYRYKDEPKDKLVGITELASAVLAVYAQRPDTARGRPGDVFSKKKRVLYNQLFPAQKQHPLQMYVTCALLHKRVEKWLRKFGLAPYMRTDLRFYVSMFVASLTLKRATPKPRDIANLDIAMISESTIDEANTIVAKEYEKLGGSETVAKGPDLLLNLKALLLERFPISQKAA